MWKRLLRKDADDAVVENAVVTLWRILCGGHWRRISAKKYPAAVARVCNLQKAKKIVVNDVRIF